MPSKLSTVRRFAHAEITDSPPLPFAADFALLEDERGLVVGFLVFWVVVVFFFRGLKSSSSESTRRGITFNEPWIGSEKQTVTQKSAQSITWCWGLSGKFGPTYRKTS
jgi:hypothetical protein